MLVNEKVMYNGKIYTVLHDYRNGQLEIRRIDDLFKVELVHVKQIVRL